MPVINGHNKMPSIEKIFTKMGSRRRNLIDTMEYVERENNKVFIEILFNNGDFKELDVTSDKTYFSRDIAKNYNGVLTRKGPRYPNQLSLFKAIFELIDNKHQRTDSKKYFKDLIDKLSVNSKAAMSQYGRTNEGIHSALMESTIFINTLYENICKFHEIKEVVISDLSRRAILTHVQEFNREAEQEHIYNKLKYCSVEDELSNSEYHIVKDTISIFNQKIDLLKLI